jgi:chromate transporter
VSEGRTSLAQIALLFLRLGTTAFGGPAAHVALMEDEVVRRRAWLTREQFLDYVGATNLIPGPNSTELAIHIGHARAGWPGLLVAGVCVIVPATLIVGLAAWTCVTDGTLPAVSGLRYGIKPVVIAVVAQALWGLGRGALKSAWLVILGVVSTVAVAAGVHELVVLGGAAAASAIACSRSQPRAALAVSVTSGAIVSAHVAAAGAPTVPATFGLWPLFLVFAKIGSVLFGSGYVLLAFLRSDLVERLHWLTEPQLLDAVAVGQITPGPVSTTATFIGYLLGGPAAAAVATIGIFVPAFVFVALSGPVVPRMRQSRLAGAVLDGVNVASLALMAVVAIALGRAAIVDATTGIIALGSAAALVRYRVNSTWLIAVGGAVGWLASR